MPSLVLTINLIKRYCSLENLWRIIRSRLKTFIILLIVSENLQKHQWITPRDFQYCMMSARKHEQALTGHVSKFSIFLDRYWKTSSMLRLRLETLNILWCLWENTQEVFVDPASRISVSYRLLFCLFLCRLHLK